MKLAMLYEGKAKKVYKTDQPNELLIDYKDDATAFNAEKKAVLAGKGQLNNDISALIFEKLTKAGVKNHFIRKLSDTEQLVSAVTIIPLEVIVRNVAAGSMAKRLGIEEGKPLERTIIEFCYKRDDLGDPLVTEDHIFELGLATTEELQAIRQQASKVNDVLSQYFDDLGIQLIDFKLEFGRKQENGELILADEVSPDTCRLWDKVTGEKLDKDVFRRDLGDLPTTYRKLLERLGAAQ
ncbi:phosphoribosylaminoimidazole-succinocarboxamide synthase [Pullulanibacillus pueri]|uniref:Phosphoribosylaminoimidazole-succinocarboxamide synthase n=1 Tax=Pullulanibacillus pueri TaxID=1437324 RepID=A0A8J3EMF7_9BACL|nr:phosphoribosylaminoimidazolesuccinocarboxamide synthase [Pullulanibacillus pueri]MBM7682761.1 phosphoribosylaminoimidazole-succinocarboxamide synthase [Pullulanibacillus pueri]GGH83086.1 phosphoribosylaminoimidazole-succinocarboxamide synthase [Pullulanibacillus pueri]